MIECVYRKLLKLIWPIEFVCCSFDQFPISSNYCHSYLIYSHSTVRIHVKARQRRYPQFLIANFSIFTKYMLYKHIHLNIGDPKA